MGQWNRPDSGQHACEVGKGQGSLRDTYSGHYEGHAKYSQGGKELPRNLGMGWDQGDQLDEAALISKKSGPALGIKAVGN